MSDAFHIQNNMKQREALSSFLFNFALNVIRNVQENREWNGMDTFICSQTYGVKIKNKASNSGRTIVYKTFVFLTEIC
jgi:hypothetical protein